MSLQQQLSEALKKQEQQEQANGSQIPRYFEWPQRFTEPQKQYIAKKLKELREAANMTQSMLDRVAGLNAQTTSNLELGKCGFNKPTLKKIGNILRNDFEQIVYDACSQVVRLGDIKDHAVALPKKAKEFIDVESMQTYKVKADKFHFEIDIDGSDVTVKAYDVANIALTPTILFHGKPYEADIFCAALKKVASLVDRGK